MANEGEPQQQQALEHFVIDEDGRHAILQALTRTVQLHSDADLYRIARCTAHFTAAELQHLVRRAVADANEQRSKITMSILEHAMTQITITNNIGEQALRSHMRCPIVNFSPRFDRVMQTCHALVDQIVKSDQQSAVSVLLHGAKGSGKTTIAAQMALQSQVVNVQYLFPSDIVALSDDAKVSHIENVFRKAYKSLVSMIVIDDIERIFEWCPSGQRYNHRIVQVLHNFVENRPFNSRILIVGATRDLKALRNISLDQAFDNLVNIPYLETGDEVQKVLSDLKVTISDLGPLLKMIKYPLEIGRLIKAIDSARSQELSRHNLEHWLRLSLHWNNPSSSEAA